MRNTQQTNIDTSTSNEDTNTNIHTTTTAIATNSANKIPTSNNNNNKNTQRIAEDTSTSAHTSTVTNSSLPTIPSFHWPFGFITPATAKNTNATTTTGSPFRDDEDIYSGSETETLYKQHPRYHHDNQSHYHSAFSSASSSTTSTPFTSPFSSPPTSPQLFIGSSTPVTTIKGKLTMPSSSVRSGAYSSGRRRGGGSRRRRLCLVYVASITVLFFVLLFIGVTFVTSHTEGIVTTTHSTPIKVAPLDHTQIPTDVANADGQKISRHDDQSTSTFTARFFRLFELFSWTRQTSSTTTSHLLAESRAASAVCESVSTSVKPSETSQPVGNNATPTNQIGVTTTSESPLSPSISSASSSSQEIDAGRKATEEADEDNRNQITDDSSSSSSSSSSVTPVASFPSRIIGPDIISSGDSSSQSNDSPRNFRCADEQDAIRTVEKHSRENSYMFNFDFVNLHPCVFADEVMEDPAESLKEAHNSTTSTSGSASAVSSNLVPVPRLTWNEIAVVVMTSAKTRNRTVAVAQSWAKGLPHVFLVSDQDNTALGTITFPELKGKPGYWDAQHRTLVGLQHVVKTYEKRDQIQWVVLVDDDTWLNVDRVRTVLSAYRPSLPMLFAITYQNGRNVWIQGGSGMLLSREAALRIGTSLYTPECPFRKYNDVTIAACAFKKRVVIVHHGELHVDKPTRYQRFFLPTLLKAAMSYHYIAPEAMGTMTTCARDGNCFL